MKLEVIWGIMREFRQDTRERLDYLEKKLEKVIKIVEELSELERRKDGDTD
jgi:hypothetical protein